MKLKKKFKSVVVFILCVACAVSICSCRQNDGNTSAKPVTSAVTSEKSGIISLENMKTGNVNFKNLQATLVLPYKYNAVFSSVVRLKDAKKQFDNFYLRENGDTRYGVVKLNRNSETQYLFMLFSLKELDMDKIEETYVFEEGMLISKLCENDFFEKIEPNITTVDDVKKIDTATYVLENLGKKGNKAESFHRCQDGSLIQINYKKSGDSYIVKGVKRVDDNIEFVSKLLPQDFESIK